MILSQKQVDKKVFYPYNKTVLQNDVIKYCFCYKG